MEAITHKLPEISILVVDDDPICLSILQGALLKMNNHVLAVTNPFDALSALRMGNKTFDLILTDVHMPQMTGLDLLKIVEEEFKLPVVLMSADQDKKMMLKGLQAGAAFYFVKPVSPHNLSKLWQFAITSSIERRNAADITCAPNNVRSNQQHETPMNVINNNNNNDNNYNYVVPLVNNQYKENKTLLLFRNNSLEKPSVADLGVKNKFIGKKPKLVWTTSLHNLFLEAVNNLGLEKAMPKKILEYMNIPGLRRENIASHLQKYRIFLKRMTDATHSMQNGIPNNWNARPFRSSFVLNEITFLTNNLHQQYQDFLMQSQGLMNVAERGQSSTQGGFNPINNNEGAHQALYQNAINNLDQSSPMVQGFHQPKGFAAGYTIGDHHQPGQIIPRNISNQIQPTNNNYVGLRMGTDGELISSLQNLPTNHGIGCGNNLANDIIMHGTFNDAEKSANNNVPLSSHFPELGDWDNNVFVPNLDQNATFQQHNSFGTQKIQNLHHGQHQTLGNGFGFGTVDDAGRAQGNLLDGLNHQGITGSNNDDDILFESFFAQEFNQQEGGADFTKPN